jgi:tripartite-type tricarboxylate transporter receptor subunit TctC
VPVLFSAYPSLVGAVEGKKVKLLANNGPTRWPQAPDVPPIAEVIPGYDLATIVGIYSRPGVPQPILDKIAAEAVAALNTPEAKKQMTTAGIAVTGGNSAVFDKALKREIENVTKVVQAAKIEPQ